MEELLAAHPTCRGFEKPSWHLSALDATLSLLTREDSVADSRDLLSGTQGCVTRDGCTLLGWLRLACLAWSCCLRHRPPNTYAQAANSAELSHARG